MEGSLLHALNSLRQARRAAIVTTDLATGSQRLYEQGAVLSAKDPLSAEIDRRFLSGQSGLVAAPQGEVFIAVYLPAPRLVIIGAVHIAQFMLVPARAAGFDLTVIDPRTAFATPTRFVDVDLCAEWPDAVLARAPLDPYTALVALTHDPKIDDGALVAALQAQCFYVGALGSRKTHAKRVERFAATGVSDADIARIHAPIGLDIGAANPAEIAIAVLAEIIKTLRGSKAGRA
ncbi:MAG: XdhC family protein [Rhizobiales bacterium]|nr:XdhC family protein [Hyphomicrobiales bacterium]